MPRPIPDTRTIVEVDNTRDFINYKRFRTVEQKDEARRRAKKYNGTWYSAAAYSVREKDQHNIVRIVVKHAKQYTDGSALIRQAA